MELNQYRHGDVGVFQAVIPAEAKAEQRLGDVILAMGEVTGHAHRIRDRHVTTFLHAGRRFMRVEGEPAALTHEEHGRIDLAPGDYEVVIQREYRPEGDRRVAD